MKRVPERGILIVSGTDTGVGKTIVTAALAARALVAGRSVAVVKPAQTGTEDFDTDQPSDAETVRRLVGDGVTVVTLAEFPAALAPLSAAKIAGLPPLRMADVVEAVTGLAERHDLVLVEGAGGLLVQMGAGPLRLAGIAEPVEMDWNIADLAMEVDAPVVVVTRAGLGTLNHTALTLEALESRGIDAHVVIGSWPARPALVHRRNLTDMPAEVVGCVPAGAGILDRRSFIDGVTDWFQ